MRKKIIVGNWKMNKTFSETEEFVQILKKNLKCEKKVDIAICPNYISLQNTKKVLQNTDIKVGSQNIFFEESGAYTGEISVKMIKDIDIDYCIIGHSERRQHFGETDEDVNKKLKKLLKYNIIPILCIGETLKQRDNDIHLDVVKNQIVQALKDVSKEEICSVIIAYEPIWAIGTGITATSNQAEEMCKYIRNIISELYDIETAEKVRIQYGGSVNVNNAKELLNMPNIDGALIGGASLKNEFIDIINSIT